MTTCVGLLRAVNVGGRNRVAMTDLRGLLSRVGFRDGQTLLQSGNVVFRSADRTPAQMERALEAAAAEYLGLETDFFVRTAAEWKAAVARNPFRQAAEQDPGHLVVVFLKKAPRAAAVGALQKSIKGREAAHLRGRHLYVVYPDGIGRSRLTISVIEQKLDVRGTGRNWNTVLKLAALAGSG